ncbi:MAG: IS200/IS605 family element transposase accessory protein TnpB [Thaumarchaeota archaeon]|nr:IS200/IS605 family element transposase accessory protein TnpB [Nitrososphaerota archaeon]
MNAFKSVKQDYHTNSELVSMMETFRQMINYCIRIGLDNNISTLKRLSSLHYKDLQKYQIQSKYKLTAMSQACGRLAQMKRSIREGKRPKSPFVTKPYLISCYGFKLNGMLLSIPGGNRNHVNIVLNQHTVDKLSEEGIQPRSFTITPSSVSISVRKEVEEIKCQNVIGIDRNLRNVTIAIPSGAILYRTNKLLSIKENTTHVIASFRRNDRRVKNKFYSQKRSRRTRRVQQFLHKISKDIVQRAIKSKSMIVFEDIKGIRKLYKRGNGQGNKFRRRLNSWSFYELQRQIQYKAAWEGLPVRFVDPKRTSQLCPICGERLQEDRFQHRKLWCNNCMKSMDRDVVAALNISYKGWSRFCHPRGLSDEAVKGNVENFQPLILGVDGSKLQVQK